MQRFCISEGGLCFTLYWAGDEELYLSVMTPVWQTLNSAITGAEDALSGGLWEYTNDASGVRIRDLFFPGDVPVGKYTYSVGSRGPSNGITWKLTIHVNGIEKESHAGIGTNSLFLVGT